MGKVESLTVNGLDLWFNSLDHLPPHFHARRPGEWEIRVYFLQCTDGHLEYDIKWPPMLEAIPQKFLRDLSRAIVGKKAKLLEEHERKTCLN